MTPEQPDIATMDERCLEFDHSFPYFELWEDEDFPPTYEEQMTMECSRCGETMRHSLQRMMGTLKNMIGDGGPV